MTDETAKPTAHQRLLKEDIGNNKYVSASYANLVYHALKNVAEVDNIFAKYGITPQRLEDATDPIRFDYLAQAVFEVIETKNLPDAGLSLGSTFHVSTHGPVGMAVISAETVGQAIKDIANYYQTSITFCNLEVYYRQNQVVLEIIETHAIPEIQTVVVEALMLTLQNALEFVSGKKLHDSHFSFAFPPPDYADQYPAYFSGKVEFNGDKHLMVLPAEIANCRCITADPNIHRLAEEQLKQKMQEIRANNLTVQHVIAELRKQPANMPSLKEMAAHFNISARTLIRHLQAEDTTYRDLRALIHKQLAIDSLRNTDNSIDSIAMELGYRDSTSFHRAFKRWCGVSPGDYRKQAAPPDEESDRS